MKTLVSRWSEVNASRSALGVAAHVQRLDHLYPSLLAFGRQNLFARTVKPTHFCLDGSKTIAFDPMNANGGRTFGTPKRLDHTRISLRIAVTPAEKLPPPEHITCDLIESTRFGATQLLATGFTIIEVHTPDSEFVFHNPGH
jgi:hypothetical protein